MQISFTPEFASRLEEHFGLREGTDHNPHGGGNTYVIERMLDEDVLLTSVGWANSYYGGEEYVDEWGVGWKSCSYETPFGKGTYTEIAAHPLEDEAAISSYRGPSPHRDELYSDAERAIREYGDEYWITGVTVTTIFETAWALRGMENLMVDFICEPERADAVLDIPFRYHFEAAKRLVSMGADMIWTGDDVGAQGAMILSRSSGEGFSNQKWRSSSRGSKRSIRM
jgi:uroporphyrinogen decarboxylase